ncbi:MAG TPA: Uma2 family endonuclease [Blastocatellia bacterium]|jgi:Uma2 family endonuclease|nr:Uma2 family endonuclease [Blastocatellia bacterium]
MTAETPDYLGVIDHLPRGASLKLDYVDWAKYERLLDEVKEKPGLRISYDSGRLRVVSPLPEHEEYKGLIHDLAVVLAEELDLKLETRGSATYKRQRDSKGAEPDESFYVKTAEAIIGKRHIDLTVDPPPDIVVEIDSTNESLWKFSIYAALGVSEIWRYDGKQAQIYRLVDEAYVESSSSGSFEMMTPTVLTEFIELSKTSGQSSARSAFRQWVRSRRP